MFSNSLKYFLSFFIVLALIPTLFIPIISNDINVDLNININTPSLDTIYLSNSNFYWPIPGYTRISSYFEKRTLPTAYASSYHQGIDIPASPGSNLIAVTNAIVTSIGFNGSAGYTIVLKNGNLEFYYHHVSPEYIVSVGNYVQAGQVIGYVGPQNVYGISNNPYKDSNGRPTNGATTGPHLHFTIKKDGKAVNPLDYFS